MIEPATAQNPAVLYPNEVAALRNRWGASVDALISQGVIVEKKVDEHGNQNSI